MTLRLIEVIVPGGRSEEVREVLDGTDATSVATHALSDGNELVRALCGAQRTERVLDALEQRFSGLEGFRVVLVAVEATLPRLAEPSRDGPDAGQTAADARRAHQRISREELYADVSAGARWSNVHLAGVVLSTLVAAVGLVKDNTAVIIGAMVIAPLLGPNMALALGTTLGDAQLILRSLRTGLGGLLVGLALALIIGGVFAPDLSVAEIASRTEVGLGDVVLALASGAAGALAFTTGAPAALIGVMVAVALLPPLVVFGLVLSIGELSAAAGAGLLLLTNVICVNLAAVVTFLAQGIRPRLWWEAARARRATTFATVLWAALLLVLVALMVLSQQ
jgi:uncharacterized hydrophobic protein (TIGR00341 family)